MHQEEKTQRVILTAQDFIDAWNGNDYKKFKKGDGKGYYASGDDIIFENIEIVEKVEIKDLKDLPTITIKNSKLSHIYLLHSSCLGICIISSIIEDFSISNSNTKKIDFSQSKAQKIHIGVKTNTENLEILSSTIQNLFIIASKTDFYYIGSSSVGSFNIIESTTGCFRLRQSKIRTFEINESTTGYCELKDTKLANFRISNSTTGKINIINKSIIGTFSIDSYSTIKGNLIIESSDILKIEIVAKELRKVILKRAFVQNFSWKQESLCMLNINNCEIELLNFDQTIVPKDSVFQINNSKVNQLNFIQLVNTGWLNVSGLEPMADYDRFVETNGRPKIENEVYITERVINKKTTLHFENSDLGKTSFVNCYLNDFDEFIFYNTKMLEVFVAGTELPKNSKKFKLPFIEENGKPKKVVYILEDENAQQRLAYSQFKKISENRGDNVQATEFLALEMDAYARQIAKDGTKRGERFNLFLNKTSSNWGNDWVQGVKVTFIATSIFGNG